MRCLRLLFVLLLGALPARAQNAWINEFHYDNTGADTGEFIEVVLQDAGSFTLSDFTVTRYDGDALTSDGSHNLSTFTEGVTVGGFTVYSRAISGIENGKEGIALDFQGVLLEFLCYEGTFTASGGPADGVTCTDVGVSESGSTPVGTSLQRTGTGATGSDFVWVGPQAESPGDVNSGQTLADPCAGNQLPFLSTLGAIQGSGTGNAFRDVTFTDPDGLLTEVRFLTLQNIVVSSLDAPPWTEGPAGTWTPPGNTATAQFRFSQETGNTAKAIFEALLTDDCDGQINIDPAMAWPLPDAPAAFALRGNYPNPFNPSTTIRFEVAASAPVRVAVYDLLGRLVKPLVDRPMAPGAFAVTWDGTDASGADVGSGVYLYRMTAGDYTATRVMTLLR